MDELPSKARELLALAREAHQPSPEARDRVRRGVALALAASAGAGAASAGTAAAASGTTGGVGAAKVGWLAGTAGKLLVAGGTVVAIGAAGVALRHAPVPHDTGLRAAQAARPQVSHVAVPSAAPSPRAMADARDVLPPSAAEAVAPAATSAAEPAAVIAPPAGKPVARVRPLRQPTHAVPAAKPSALAAEMSLLAEASSALARGELVRARGLLQAHRAQFAHGQLGEERRGLETLAHCMTADTGAVTDARAYLRTAPDGVLAERIARACKLGNGS